MTAKAVRIDIEDNVATLLADVAAGETVVAAGAALVAAVAIPRGHKIALKSVAPGEAVIKYGYPIGHAIAAIAAGEHVHSGNLATSLGGQQAYAYTPAPRANLAPGDATFRGYRRADGRVGTRNEIWVLPTVGCVARTAERIAAQAGAALTGKVDGVHAFAHPFGCSQLGEDLEGVLEEIQNAMLDTARERRERHSVRGRIDYPRFREIMEGDGAFVYAGWCGSAACEAAIKEETKATIRVLPDEEFQSAEAPTTCLKCNQPARSEALWAKAY